MKRPLLHHAAGHDPNQLYPDLVHFLYRYTIPNLQPRTFVEAMRQLGFRPDRRARGGMLGALETPGPGSEPRRIPVVANRGRDSVSFKFPVNVLRSLHEEETRDFSDERSSTGDNWLHRDAFHSSEPVWARAFEEVTAIAPHLDRLADDIAGRMQPAGVASLRDQRVNTIELAADIEADSPRAVFRRLLPRFKERFCRLRLQGYERGTRALWAGELWHDSNLIRGYLATGISFKLYEKTNRRIRLEAEYTREGLGRLRAPVVVDGDELRSLWEFLAAHCLPEMNDVLQRARIIPTYHWDLETLLAVVAPIICRWSRVELETLATAVIHDHRITTRTLPSRKLSRLHDAGVLNRIERRGVYAIAPECEIAFRELLAAALRCQRRIARETDFDYREAAE